MGNKIKKIIGVVFNVAIVLVPVVLLACGVWMNTGAVWDVLCVAGIGLILYTAYKQFTSYKMDEARAKTAIVATIAAFLILTLQALFCNLLGGQQLVVEISLTWFMFLLALGGYDAVRQDPVDNKLIRCGLCLLLMFPALVTIGGISDIAGYFGYNLPERLADILALLVGVSIVGGLFCMIVAFVRTKLLGC